MVWYGDHLDLLSFPTRRSSDLGTDGLCNTGRTAPAGSPRRPLYPSANAPGRQRGMAVPGGPGWRSERVRAPRSEEHTSELQSRENLVCRLLLEKKKEKDSMPMM